MVPAAVVRVAVLTTALPGHQARNRPLPVVATTFEPSLNVNLAAVTPEPTEPSALSPMRRRIGLVVGSGNSSRARPADGRLPRSDQARAAPVQRCPCRAVAGRRGRAWFVAGKAASFGPRPRVDRPHRHGRRPWLRP